MATFTVKGKHGGKDATLTWRDGVLTGDSDAVDQTLGTADAGIPVGIPGITDGDAEMGEHGLALATILFVLDDRPYPVVTGDPYVPDDDDEVEEEDEELEEAVVTNWIESLHPRDLKGRFVRKIGKLTPRGEEGPSVFRLPDDTRVAQEADGTYRVSRRGRTVRGLATPEEAAQNALDRSSRATDNLLAIGGRQRFRDFGDAATQLSMNLRTPAPHVDDLYPNPPTPPPPPTPGDWEWNGEPMTANAFWRGREISSGYGIYNDGPDELPQAHIVGFLSNNRAVVRYEDGSESTIELGYYTDGRIRPAHLPAMATQLWRGEPMTPSLEWRGSTINAGDGVFYASETAPWGHVVGFLPNRQMVTRMVGSGEEAVRDLDLYHDNAIRPVRPAVTPSPEVLTGQQYQGLPVGTRVVVKQADDSWGLVRFTRQDDGWRMDGSTSSVNWGQDLTVKVVGSAAPVEVRVIRGQPVSIGDVVVLPGQERATAPTIIRFEDSRTATGPELSYMRVRYADGREGNVYIDTDAQRRAAYYPGTSPTPVPTPTPPTPTIAETSLRNAIERGVGQPVTSVTTVNGYVYVRGTDGRVWSVKAADVSYGLTLPVGAVQVRLGGNEPYTAPGAERGLRTELSQSQRDLPGSAPLRGDIVHPPPPAEFGTVRTPPTPPTQTARVPRPQPSRPAAPVVNIGEDYKERAQAIVNALHDFDAEGYTVRITHASGYRDTLSFNGTVHTTDGTNVGSFTRDVNFESGSVYHASFSMQAEHRGGGFGTKFIEHAFASYKAQGIREVRVSAGLSAGGYQWAKMGFKITSSTVKDFAQGLLYKLEGAVRDGVVSADLAAEFRRQIQEGQITDMMQLSAFGKATPWEVTVERKRHKLWLGKHLLIGASWSGTKTL